MRGLSREARIGLVERDVILVRRHAKVIFSIKGDRISIEENQNGRLGVIAVVGSSYSPDLVRSFEEAVLLEVGIGSSRPYHEARGLNRGNGESNIPKRLKECWLTEDQYIQIAPLIFQSILQLAKDRVKRWNGSHYSFCTPDRRYLKKKKGIRYREVFKDWPRGARFAVSCLDELLLADVFFAERHVNRNISSGITRHAKMMSLVLADLIYQEDLSPDLKESLKEGIQKKGVHVRRYILEKIPEIIRQRWLDDLREIFGISIEREHEELDLIKASTSLSNVGNRVDGVQLEITTGLDSRKDHVVFEVFPYTDEMYFNPEWIKIQEENKKTDSVIDQFSDCPF